jgi:hypothetical protein
MTGCLGDDTIAAMVDGTLDAPLRESAVRHMAECVTCRSTLAAVTRAVADPAVAREAAATERVPRRGMPWGVMAAGVAAAMVLLLVRPQPAGLPLGVPRHRAPGLTNGTAPAALSPVGPVDGAAVLRWGAVAGADRYRATLFSANGDVLYEIELADTAAVLPDSVALLARTPYLWKVEARTGFDRWISSDLVEFSIAAREGR